MQPRKRIVKVQGRPLTLFNNPRIRKRLGSNIEERRYRAGLTREMFAEKLNISLGRLTEIETADWTSSKQNPSIELIRSMCEILKCEPSDLAKNFS